MRQTRSAGRNRNSGGRAAQQQQQQQVKEQQRQHEEQLSALDSPLCMKHRGKPVMSAERFLLIVSQLQAKANELWEQEQHELQRGAELMVISCAPASPRSPPPQPSLTPKATGSPSSPAAFHHPNHHANAGPFEHAAGLLHGASGLASPSLLPLGGHFNSPTSWSPGLDALAQQLGLGLMPSSTSVDPADESIAGINGSHLHHGHHHQHQPHHHQPGHQGHSGPAQHHLQHQQPHHGNQGQLGGGSHAGDAPGAGAQGVGVAGLAHAHPLFTSGLGLYADAEALVTLYPAAGGERAAKTRLLEKFEASGTATARQAAAGHDPFASLLSGTPRAEDFLGSPSWTPSAYL